MSLGALLAFARVGHADDVVICFNYGCSTHAAVHFSDQQLNQIHALFAPVADAQAERDAVSRAIGEFERFAGMQTPTWRDRGGDYNDDGVDGRMDCIDHSHNTTAYLRVVEDHGWLKFHEVGPKVRRSAWILGQHFAGRIVDTKSGQEYAVDSWFFDNGQPAAIFRLEEWMKGARPK